MPAKNKFDQLNVVSPCPVSWEQMSGNQKQRFCGQCNKNVYDFSQMTRSQIEAITFARKGELCARITRREDGTMEMLESLAPPSTRRVSPLAGAVVSAILGISVPAAAQPATLPAAIAMLQSEQAGQDAKKADAKTPANGATSSIRGVVRDPQGAVIAGATVVLTAENPRAITVTSAEGVFEFPTVAVGVYKLSVQAAGFRTAIIEDINVAPAEAAQVDVMLQIGSVTLGGAVAVAIEAPPTLLRLHRESDLIAIVTVGKSKLVKSENESKQFLTALNVSTLLKGDGDQRAIPFYHWVSDDRTDKDDQINPGDTLLVFLDHRKSEDNKPASGYEPSTWSRAVKKLDGTALSVYRQRIEELTPILQHSQDNNAELIEWLVRCIEEPATRWDGVSELSRLTVSPISSEQAKQKEQPDEKSIAIAAAQSDEKSEESEESESVLLTLLNEGQRTRVLNALFSIQELQEGDMALVELVRGLDDKRLVTYLISQLHRLVPEAPEMAETLVTTIAEILDDDAIEKAADQYRKNAEYNRDDQEEENNSQKAPAPSLAAQVATAKRSAMLKQFLALLEQTPHR